MNIVFNTFYEKAAASMYYKGGLQAIHNITCNDYDNYTNYDIALFMTYPRDLAELKRAKIENRNLITAIVDPRGSQIDPFVEYTDFFIIDSIEMNDFFAKYRRPMYKYYEYPKIPLIPKKHTQKDRIIIGYHGNKAHLTAMYPEITSALEALGEKYDIELWAIYNIKNVGVWDIGVPRNINVRHLQWSMSAYEEYLSKVDIGIVPSCMPVKERTRSKSVVSKFFLDNKDDYLIKFKMPSNPGRLIIFAQLGIPVVADFLPSNIQFIRDGENGFLAKTTGGWYRALEQLIVSYELRNDYADAMMEIYQKYFDYEVQNRKIKDFFEKMLSCERDVRQEIIPREYWVERLKFNNAYLYEKMKKIKERLR